MESADESGTSIQRPRPIASQACNTCRARKTKCDENRPRCGLCERVNATCIYQEPRPVKKDKTLQEILSTLEVLHQKVDRLGSDRSRDRKTDLAILATNREIVEKSALRSQAQSSTSRQSLAVPAPPEVKRILLWPAVARILRSDLDELHGWDNNFSSTEEWLSRITEVFGKPLVVEGRADVVTEDAPYFQSSGARTLPLSNEMINDLTSAFFSCFHCMYPILDRHYFFNTTLPQAKSSGFGESDEASPLVLLVLALGSVAQQGAVGAPVLEPDSKRETGVKGGEVQKPPGLQLLQEAHRRMGLLLPECTLTLLQCHLLSAIYYSQCSRNLEYWRLTEKSCTLCESLYKLGRGWGTKEMQIFNRSFWMCVLLESGPTGELGLSRTHITELQDEIQDPKSLLYSLERDPDQHQEYLIGHHFLAQVYLRTLLNQINNDLRSTRNLLSDVDQAAPTHVIKALAQYLQDWRNKLPPELNWDGDATLCSSPETYPETIYVSLDGDGFSYNMLDPMLILTASLQTRYKYALFLIYRPYIYKALHTPDAMTQEDLIGCEKALHACTHWPLLLDFFQAQKRLLPHLYEYSHTFFSILILLHVCKSSTILEPILRSDSLMEAIDESTTPLLLWLRDMQVVHPVASWCWTLIRVLYQDHPVVTD